MKTLIYFESADRIKQSGIGRAMKHELKALSYANVETTIDKNDTYDIAHINTYFSKSKKVLKKCKKKGIPVIVHGHSTKEDFRMSFKCWQLIAPFFNHAICSMYKNADLIITPTPHSKRLIEAYGFNKKVIAISNGIDLEEYKRDEEAVKEFKEAFNIKEGEKFVIGVGFPFERKGIIDFFEVARSFPDVKFFWFGQLNRFLMNEKVARAIRKKPANAIMPGYTKGKLIRGAYQSATCLFFPTYEENEGIVVLEALASYCPLVLRDIDVYSDWLTDGVSCHKGKNNGDFAGIIRNLLNNGEKEEILFNGYEIAKKRDLHIIGEELKEAYQSLLNKK